MGHIIIKPDPNRNFYVEWSTVTETPVGCGDRAEMLDDGIDPERLDRADLNGSSALGGYELGWWNDAGYIYEQRGWLARKNLAAAACLLCEGREAEVWDLLTPFEDEAEVRRG